MISWKHFLTRGWKNWHFLSSCSVWKSISVACVLFSKTILSSVNIFMIVPTKMTLKNQTNLIFLLLYLLKSVLHSNDIPLDIVDVLSEVTDQGKKPLNLWVLTFWIKSAELVPGHDLEPPVNVHHGAAEQGLRGGQWRTTWGKKNC